MSISAPGTMPPILSCTPLVMSFIPWHDRNDARLEHDNQRIFGTGTEQVHTLTGRSNHMFVDAVQSPPDASARERSRRHQALKAIDLNDGNRNKKQRISEFDEPFPDE